jgi:hypothetical protein
MVAGQGGQVESGGTTARDTTPVPARYILHRQSEKRFLRFLPRLPKVECETIVNGCGCPSQTGAVNSNVVYQFEFENGARQERQDGQAIPRTACCV